MNIKSLLKNEHLLTILHNVLENETTKNKISNVSINGEVYEYNRYSLLIIMDFIIKYKIVIESDVYNDELLKDLEMISYTYLNHQDLVLSLNNLLIKYISKVLNITNIDNISNQKQILMYLYDEYIVNGYCFHSFPSHFKEYIEENGLDQAFDYKQLNYLKKINYIFNNHNYKNIISKKLNSKTNAIYITDSPAMAYYYAFRSPYYLAEVTSISSYYKNIPSYDKEAFYRKDYNACKTNLTNLCNHTNMTEKEKDTVLKSFNKLWENLNMSNSFPCIAFIKRKDLAKNSLSNIDEIINSIGKVELVYLISKITDSKYSIIRRFSPIDSINLNIITMPSYREIKNNKFLSKEKPKAVVKIKKEEVIVPEEKINFKYTYSYGNASVLALTGLLLITLGMTITIIINVLGG